MKKKLFSRASCCALVVGLGTVIMSLSPLPGNAVAADSSTPASASPAAVSHPRGRVQWLAAALGLSGEQQQQIQAIRAAGKMAIGSLRRQLKESKEQLRTLGKADSFDEAAVRELVASLEPIHSELLVAQARMRNEIRAVLTPDQRLKADSLMAARDGKRRHGRRGQHGWEEMSPRQEQL